MKRWIETRTRFGPVHLNNPGNQLKLFTRTIFLQMPRQLQGKLQLLKVLGKSLGLMSATSTVLLGSQQHKENLNLSPLKV